MYADYNLMCEKLIVIESQQLHIKPRNEQCKHCLLFSVLHRMKDFEISFKKKVIIAEFYMGLKNRFKLVFAVTKDYFLNWDDVWRFL